MAAVAAECAGEQGRYWEMHQALFAAPSEWDTTREAAMTAFGRYAGAIGIASAPFDACITEQRYLANVESNFAEGRYLGITGTPAFVINGKLLAGAHEYAVFERAFDTELAALAGE